MSRFFPDLAPIFKVICRIADALDGIDKSLNRVVEIVDQPVKRCKCGETKNC